VGVDFQVHEPRELVTFIKELATRLTKGIS
jgi:hypothetical protein